MNIFLQKRWSPYVCGILIGLLQIPALLLIDTALGTSSAYVWIVGKIGAYIPAFASPYATNDLSSISSYWQVFMGIGIILGAALSTRLARIHTPALSSFFTRQGYTPQRRMLSAFIGGFIVLFGARMAGGCTSGHGLSGVAQLCVASLITTTCMFIGAIAVANILYRRT